MIAPAMLSSAIAELLSLPRLDWREDGEYGVTGIATGRDAQVRADVWEWALAFGLKPTVVDPEPEPEPVEPQEAESEEDPAPPVMSPGVIFVELPILGVEVTIAGRLIDAPEVVRSAAEEERERKAQRDAWRADIRKRAGIA